MHEACFDNKKKKEKGWALEHSKGGKCCGNGCVEVEQLTVGAVRHHSRRKRFAINLKACLWCSHFITCLLFMYFLLTCSLFVCFFFSGIDIFILFIPHSQCEFMQCQICSAFICNTQHINAKDDLAFHFHA